MIPISHPMIGEEEKAAVLEVLASGQLAQGPKVREFEDSFAAWCGVEHAVATSSGTTALHLALLAHGVGPGDEVITSPFSFVATANAICFAGARPVFADIEPDSFNLSPLDTERRVTARTRSIVPVHLFGHPAEMGAFAEIARSRGIALIEDACQAHGAEYRGRKVGSFGTGCFSFYPTKNMTSGEGGMVTTGDPAIADRVRLLRNHGMRQRYYHESVGFNFRMTDLHAAIGLVQLRKLDRWNRARIDNADYLTARLADVVECPRVREGIRHVFHQYTVRVPGGRQSLQEWLQGAGVSAGVYYPVPIHLQRHYLEMGYRNGSFPVAEAVSEQVLSLPVHPGLSRADLEAIVSAVRQGVSGLLA
ncbi:MAG: DegT/DnrJ/EryC1/StrS family aminotransferase [Chloroflexota bacterium]